MPIVTRFGSLEGPLDDAIRRHFPAAQWVNAAEIAYMESRWDPHATNDTRHLGGGECNVRYTLGDGTPALTEYSVGAWQINLCVHTIDESDARDPERSTAFAASLWAQSGWTPWLRAARQLDLLPRGPAPGAPGAPPPPPAPGDLLPPGTVITLEITIKSIRLT